MRTHDAALIGRCKGQPNRRSLRSRSCSRPAGPAPGASACLSRPAGRKRTRNSALRARHPCARLQGVTPLTDRLATHGPARPRLRAPGGSRLLVAGCGERTALWLVAWPMHGPRKTKRTPGNASRRVDDAERSRHGARAVPLVDDLAMRLRELRPSAAARSGPVRTPSALACSLVRAGNALGSTAGACRGRRTHRLDKKRSRCL